MLAEACKPRVARKNPLVPISLCCCFQLYHLYWNVNDGNKSGHAFFSVTTHLAKSFFALSDGIVGSAVVMKGRSANAKNICLILYCFISAIVNNN